MFRVSLVLPGLVLAISCDTRPRPVPQDTNEVAAPVKKTATDLKVGPLDANGEPKLTACGRVVGALCRRSEISGSLSMSEFGLGLRRAVDFDGDRIDDVAVGAPSANTKGGQASGLVQVVSGASGVVLWEQEGLAGEGLGSINLPVPDIDGDGLSDLIVTAPKGQETRVLAVSPKKGKPLWQASGGLGFGRSLALAHDETGDGVAEIWVGEFDLKGKTGTVGLRDGKTGKRLRELRPHGAQASFGAQLDSVSDLNKDGTRDLLVAGDTAVYLFSGGKTAKLLHQWPLAKARLVNAGDMDHDGFDDIAITAASGEVLVYSGESRKLLWRWKARQLLENYGASMAPIGDVNHDGHADLAIGAPGYRSGDGPRTGRVELRSGDDGSILAEAIGDAQVGLGSSIAISAVGSRSGRRGIWVGAPRSKRSDGEIVGAVELYEF